MGENEWEAAVAAAWLSIDDIPEDEFLGLMESLAASFPGSGGDGAFELAGANDSLGHPEAAIPGYFEALDSGLEGTRLRRAAIQLASSLRIVGRAPESAQLLEAERSRTSDELDDAVVVFLALALCDLGRAHEAAGLAIGALAPHLPYYQRSAAAYAAELAGEGPVG